VRATRTGEAHAPSETAAAGAGAAEEGEAAASGEHIATGASAGAGDWWEAKALAEANRRIQRLAGREIAVAAQNSLGERWQRSELSENTLRRSGAKLLEEEAARMQFDRLGSEPDGDAFVLLLGAFKTEGRALKALKRHGLYQVQEAARRLQEKEERGYVADRCTMFMILLGDVEREAEKAEMFDEARQVGVVH
jgi:hypothetical protein